MRRTTTEAHRHWGRPHLEEITMSLHRPILAALLGLTGVLAAACSDDGAAAAHRQTLRLHDFAFDMPDTIDGPLIDLDVVNDGDYAHAFAVAQITPGTTADQAVDALLAGTNPPPDFILGDPGGINLLGPGESVRYQRLLQPGTYVLICPFPGPDAESNHAAQGMARVFQVADTNTADLPQADRTISLHDDAINLPELVARPTSYAITNDGRTPHELYIAGIPTDDPAVNDIDTVAAQVGEWIEQGQHGPAPHDADFPGGHETIAPGDTVVLTMTLHPGYTYKFDDNTSDQPLTAVAATP
jgi:hypothetical protein